MARERRETLALVGYRGTGKTTVGRLLADRLGLPFVDADRALEGRAGRSIASIFAEEGEPAFRELEEAVLAEIADGPPVVLATGGGVVVRESNRALLKGLGLVVWLDAPADVIADRLRADPQGRPSLTPAGVLDEIAQVLEVRRPFYHSVADAVVSTEGRTPAEVARIVLDHWARRGSLK